MRDLPASRETSSEMATWSFVRVSERFSTSVWHELPVRGGFVVKGTVNDNSDRLSLSTSTPCLTLYDKKRLTKGGSRAPQDPPPSYAIDSCERLPSFLPGRYTSASHVTLLTSASLPASHPSAFSIFRQVPCQITGVYRLCCSERGPGRIKLRRDWTRVAKEHGILSLGSKMVYFLKYLIEPLNIPRR